MKKIIRNIFTTLLLSICSLATMAQDGKDIMRDNGRIYVVVAVMVTILLGLIIYLVRIDRKLGRLEKEINPRT